MNNMGKQLIRLAKRHYQEDLSPLEEGILLAVGAGKIPDCKNQNISSIFLTWLCTNHITHRFIPHTGIQLTHAQFPDYLNLSFAVIPFPLAFFDCNFSKDLNLRHAEIRNLDLKKCTCKSILADGLRTKGEVNLRDSKTKGVVRFLNANIGGNLDCTNGTFTASNEGNNEGIALAADGIKVAGSVFLQDKFKAQGAVRLLNANIGGVLDCTNGTFTDPSNDKSKSKSKGVALHADRIKVAGSVFLREGFEAQGAVRLLGADIGGNLECDQGRFTDSGNGESQGIALYADNIKVAGNVFLRHGFHAQGEVSLIKGSIGGGLCMTEISRPEESTLILDQAKAGFLYDDKDSWPKKGNLSLDGFTYDRISERSPLDFTSRREWLNLQPQDGKYRPQPYEQLAKVLQEAGHEGDAKKICIERRKALARTWHFLPRFRSQPLTRWQPLKIIWDLLLRWLLGYGYKPIRTLRCMLGIIMFGLGLFAWADHVGIMTEFQKSSIFEGKQLETTFAPKPYPRFSPFWYSLDAFVPLVDLHQEDYWMPDPAAPAKQLNLWLWQPNVNGTWVRVYLWWHIILGWVLTSLFVVGLTGMMRKNE